MLPADYAQFTTSKRKQHQQQLDGGGGLPRPTYGAAGLAYDPTMAGVLTVAGGDRPDMDLLMYSDLTGALPFPL